MNTQELKALIKTGEGLVNRRIFCDQEIYQQELRRIFTRCWLYLGHESQLNAAGDYFTTYMGEDPVIVWRDRAGKIRAFLNSCRHRGMKLCRTDFGNANSLSCNFHGWTYNSEGKLIGVPLYNEVYFGALDRNRWELREVDKIASYGGFIFGCWDSGAMSLDDYLGDLRWYIDVMVERPLGGLEVISGMQRYTLPVNWKLQAENFAGDTYHVLTTHRWIGKIGVGAIGLEVPEGGFLQQKCYSLAFEHGHGLLEIQLNSEFHESDLAAARRLGSEAVDYVKACRARLESRLSPKQAAVYSWGVGNIFPNFALQNFQALRPVELYVWQPHGPDRIDVWQWCAIDRGAPEIVRQGAISHFLHHQSAAGLFGEDDGDNFEQITAAMRGVVSQSLEFNYQMGLGGRTTDYPQGYPGDMRARISEHPQRKFFSYWEEMMTAGD
jgi:phenylpropionate dioxygenase-like ring-hydroxylating dioxygenase large terminal subunit